MVKLLPNAGVGDVVFTGSVTALVSSDLVEGTTVTDVSLRFGTIELFVDNSDLTSFNKDECEVVVLLVVVLRVVASLADCFTFGRNDCDAPSTDFLPSFGFLTLFSCLEEQKKKKKRFG